MSTLCVEEQLENKDFFISQDGKFYCINNGETLESWAHNYLKNNLNVKELSTENSIYYLINRFGYVGYKHVRNDIIIIKPKYELYGMKMSNIQKKNLVDYVINVEQNGSAIQTLISILELDSDDCSIELHKRR